MPVFPGTADPPFAIFSAGNHLDLDTWTASSTGTPVSGFPASAALSSRIYSTWQAPAGGPHTLRLTKSTGTIYTAHVFVVASPSGRPMIGDVTIEVRDASDVLRLQATLSRRAPEGLPDRRFLFVQEGVNVKHLDLICPTGSEIGRVYVGESVDLTGLTGGNWRQWIESLARLQQGGMIGVWSKRDQQERPRRAKRRTDTIKAGFLHQISPIRSAFLRKGKQGEVVWLPRAAEPSDASGLLDVMHQTGIFGRFASGLRIRRGDTRVVPSGFMEGSTLRTFDVSMDLVDFY